MVYKRLVKDGYATLIEGAAADEGSQCRDAGFQLLQH